VSIIAFFIVAIIACGTFVAFCSRHPADLVAADYYEQEVRYQGQIDRLQHAQQRAQLAHVDYQAGAKTITVALPPNLSGSTVSGEIELYRPSALDQDRKLKLQPNAEGVQNIDASGLLPGLWKVRVSWTADNQDYYLDQKVVVR
jgi:nitrogen fixation protein FixH